DLEHIAGVMVTHEHGDHMSIEHLRAIAAANPDVTIFTPSDAAKQLAGLNVRTVTGGDQATVGPFKLQFYGAQHALIHPSRPMCENVGVLVNGQFYYPGDALTLPGIPVQILALPISGPWQKTGEIMDFLDAVKPNVAVPTHDALLSDIGITITENWFGDILKRYHTDYRRLATGESFEF
ncbi:MAG TPA: MBL fold metallo-hydrolase, partial [Candidatus Saccharimonadales bacterium]|nr:MBL fold metallo-hydrolase [Candidatus Saccharimonadales bacterium]